jgi:hypothetical protein
MPPREVPVRPRARGHAGGGGEQRGGARQEDHDRHGRERAEEDEPREHEERGQDNGQRQEAQEPVGGASGVVFRRRGAGLSAGLGAVGLPWRGQREVGGLGEFGR